LIADQGPGFSLKMKDRLFKKFSCGDTAKVGGLGLGLLIVHGFIKAQGGEPCAAKARMFTSR